MAAAAIEVPSERMSMLRPLAGVSFAGTACLMRVGITE